jgi:hypothetical protein
MLTSAHRAIISENGNPTGFDRFMPRFTAGTYLQLKKRAAGLCAAGTADVISIV